MRYTYDKLNRLIREDNKPLGQTWLLGYDNNGNILAKREFAFSLRDRDLLEELPDTAARYTYDGDRLMTFGEEAFVYDGLGNPTTYRGNVAVWEKGRQLKQLGAVTFGYDGQGRRISKGNILYSYGSDGKLLKQSDGIEYLYDHAGMSGIKYSGETYLYRRNAQGDVTALLDSTGKVVVKYVYDGWGNHAVLCLDMVNGKPVFKDADETFSADYVKYQTLGKLNPIRYRSYYYDTETGLYFLKTRYYDPEIGRFMTIDDLSYLDPDTINGLNLYAYCGNNPVMYTDPEGTARWWEWLLLGLLAVVSVVAIGFGIALSGGSLALLGGVLFGAGTGFLGGAGASIIGQGISTGWNWDEIDPVKALESGAIGAAIGAVTGLGSGVLGQIGQAYGKIAGNLLGNASIAGLNVGKAYAFLGGTKTLMAIGGFLGKAGGAIVGGALANQVANNMFGRYSGIEENIRQSTIGLLQDYGVYWIYNLFKWVKR